MSDGHGTSDAPLSTLRGAGAPEVSVRLLRDLAAGICVLALATLSAVLFVAAAHKNAQDAALKHRGVRVGVTITGCVGLLGGSGSNAAGYACRGSFTLDGQRHDEAIPGDVLRPPGTRLVAVAVPGDAALVATPAEIAADRPSAGAYLLPALLAVLVLVAVGLLGVLSVSPPSARPRP